MAEVWLWVWVWGSDLGQNLAAFYMFACFVPCGSDLNLKQFIETPRPFLGVVPDSFGRLNH